MPHEIKGSKKEKNCAKSCHTEQWNNISSEKSLSQHEDENQCEFGNNSMARKCIVRKRCGLCKKLFDSQKLLNLHKKTSTQKLQICLQSWKVHIFVSYTKLMWRNTSWSMVLTSFCVHFVARDFILLLN